MLALLCAATPGAAFAQYLQNSGTETVPGDHPATWNVGGRLTVGNTSTATLNINTGAAVTSTEGYVGTVVGSNGTVVINAGSWTNAGELFVGYQGTGILTASGAAQLQSNIGRVGELAGSNGTVTLSGTGTNWTSTSVLHVGIEGTGVLNISGGATAQTTTGVIGTSAGGNGTVNISGTGSTLTNSAGLFVGVRGQGNLNVSAGGAVTSAGAVIGRYSGGVGIATLNGANATWNMGANELRVGGDNTDALTNPGGTGTLNIQTGAHVTNGAAYLGDTAPAQGTVNVSGTGAVWTVGGTAYVGRAGTGTVNVQTGGAMNVSAISIGDQVGATGTVNVSGAGATLTDSGRISVGNLGTGTVNVQTGGAMNVSGTSIGDQAGATGTVNVSGAGATYTDSARIGVGNFGTGTLNVSGGAVVGNTSAIIGWQDSGRGTLTVDGTGSQFNNSGVLYVGNVGQGTMTVTNGGVVTSTDGYVGAEVNSGALTSTATISGAGSRWTNSGDLFVAHNGKGVLNVSANATVTATQGILGDLAGSQGTLNLASNGSLTTTGDFNVGRFGTGTLSMLSGGQLSANRSYIANEAGASGTATVSGTGTLWQTTGRLAVGGGGSGTLTVSDAATVRANEIAIGLLAGSTGVLNVGAAAASPAAAAGTLDATTLRLGAGTATLNLNHTSNNYVLSANTIGNGTVNVIAGTTILTGANTYTGATTISSGATLQAGNGGTAGTLGAGNITDNGTLAFNRSDAYSVANVISGTGALTQSGAGNLTLTGINNYSGATTVNAGTLSVNGSIISATTVNSGGIIGGTGIFGNVTVANGGVLAPGNGVGTAHVTGDLTFNAGSVYRVEAEAGGAADKTAVTGNVTLNGTVDVRAGSGNYARNTSYTILTQTGTQTGTFSGVTSNLAFLTPTLTYQAGAVVLNLATNGVSYSAVSQTGNQRSIGSYLNGFAGSTGTLGQLVAQIDGMSAEQARIAFDNLSGSQYAGMSQMAGAMGRNFLDAINGRNSGAGAGGGATVGALKTQALAFSAGTGMGIDAPAQLAGMLGGGASTSSAYSLVKEPSRSGLRDTRETGRAASAGSFARTVSWAPNPANQTGAWGQALGAGGNIRGDGNGAGSNYQSGGFIVGLDRSVNERWLVGVAAGYQRASWDASTNGIAPATGHIETPQGALYARYSSGPWMLNVAGGYANHKFVTTRNVSVGTLSGAANSTHRGDEWGFSAQAEYALAAGAWQLRPLAGLRYAHLREDGFTESGSGPANLSVDARTTQNTTVSAGLRLLRPFVAGEAGGFEVRAIASHLFGDNDSPITARVGNTAASFTATGTPLKRDALTLGTGVSGKLGRNLSGFADVSYEMRGSGQNAYALGAGMRYVW